MPNLEYSELDFENIRNNFQFRALPALAGVSEQAGGIKTSTRFIRSTQFYTRMAVSGFSFLLLIPGNNLLTSPHNFWDWSSIAAIARNFVETYHAFWYLVDPDITEDEVEMRIALMHLHRNCELYRLYKDWGRSDDQLQDFLEGIPKDRDRLNSLVAFQSLSEGHRSELLKGKQSMHLSHTQIGESLPLMNRHFRPIYRIFSNQVHSTPLASQSQSNERGRGIENEAERFYITLAIQVVTIYACSSVVQMGRIFPKQIGGACSGLLNLAKEASTFVESALESI